MQKLAFLVICVLLAAVMCTAS